MKNLLLSILLIVVVFVNKGFAQEQKPRYWDDVQTIRKFDKMFAQPASPILFTGSSSIRKWDDLELVFAPFAAMNRGLGGAVINDIIYYADELIFSYKPRQIVLYVGENDLGDTLSTPDSILNRTKHLFSVIREKLPEVPIVYISIKPSPVRDRFLTKAIECNQLIKEFLKEDPLTVYVDVFSKMLTKEGKSMPELFLDDMLHMNSKGYDIWYAAILPTLLKKSIK